MTPPSFPFDEPGRYRIEVGGLLDPEWSEWFDGFCLSYTDSTSTRLTGFVQDQAALHGLLARVRDLGLSLIKVERLDRFQK